jgi:hypothetical protein
MRRCTGLVERAFQTGRMNICRSATVVRVEENVVGSSVLQNCAIALTLPLFVTKALREVRGVKLGLPYLMTESKQGMSALQMKRTLDVSYETAWYLCHRIRAAMREIKSELLRGVVEVDETYVGGKLRGMGKGYKGNKAIAIGALQREGKIRLQVIPNATKAIWTN